MFRSVLTLQSIHYYLRVKKAKLHFDNGNSHEVTLKPSYKKQVIGFPTVKTQKVKFELLEVSKAFICPMVISSQNCKSSFCSRFSLAANWVWETREKSHWLSSR